MSAAAQPIRTVTRGYSQIPNAFIENLLRFTPAEQSLALIILRRGGPNVGVKISDATWEAWTGLKPRAKEYAIKGLTAKGLEVEGRGENARYTFRRNVFEDYLRYQEPDHGRTVGRSKVKAVPAKPGAMVHPDCASGGCGMMRQELNGCSSESTRDAQPVAHNSGAAAAAGGVSLPGSNLRVFPSGSIQNAQPVARRSSDPVSQIWSKSLATVQALFPLADEIFLVRLVAAVETSHRSLTDDELAAGVALAWKWKKRTQQAEGLFLLTVPAAVAALRKVPKPEQAPAVSDGVGRLLARASAALAAHGDVFAAELAHVEKLRGHVANENFDLMRAESSMEQIETSVIKRGGRLLGGREAELLAAEDQAERDYVRMATTGKMARTRESIPQTLLADLRAKARTRKVLELLDIPRLSAFYA
jgi:hypothetical protein